MYDTASNLNTIEGGCYSNPPNWRMAHSAHNSCFRCWGHT